MKDGKRVAAGFSSCRWKEVKTAIKYEVIHCRSEKYPVSIMCKFFGVSRSGYYDYVRRRGLLPRTCGTHIGVSGELWKNLWLPTSSDLAGT